MELGLIVVVESGCRVAGGASPIDEDMALKKKLVTMITDVDGQVPVGGFCLILCITRGC